MSDDLMTTEQIVNIFCNMQGVTMNETQREALSSLLRTIFESGQPKEEPGCDKCKSVEPLHNSFGYGNLCKSCHDSRKDTIKCIGCETLVPESDIELQTYSKGLGPYCSSCRKIVHIKCDGCKVAGRKLKDYSLELFGGLGSYCEFCIQTNKDELRRKGAK